jgi:hypothetical protein
MARPSANGWRCSPLHIPVGGGGNQTLANVPSGKNIKQRSNFKRFFCCVFFGFEFAALSLLLVSCRPRADVNSSRFQSDQTSAADGGVRPFLGPEPAMFSYQLGQIVLQRAPNIRKAKDCLRAVVKDADPEHVWLQYFHTECKDTQGLTPTNMFWELRGTIGNYEVKGNSNQNPLVGGALGWILKKSGLDRLRGGYLYLPNEPSQPVGMWGEAFMEGSQTKTEFVLGALCSPKDPITEPVTDFQTKIDFSSTCDLNIENDMLVGIKPKFQSTQPRPRRTGSESADQDESKKSKQNSESSPPSQPSAPKQRGFVSGKSNCTRLSCYTCTYTDIAQDNYTCSHASRGSARRCAFNACNAGGQYCRDRDCVTDSIGFNNGSSQGPNPNIDSSAPPPRFGRSWTCTAHNFINEAFQSTHPDRETARRTAFTNCGGFAKGCKITRCAQ